MAVEVRIIPQYRRHIRAAEVRGWCRAALNAETAGRGRDLTVLLTGDDEVRTLNRVHRGIDEPTDVLSFPSATEGFPMAAEGARYLGDIAVSVPRAQAQAADAGHSLNSELQLLVVHGVLHLLGYDHGTEEERASMWARQDAILREGASREGGA